MIKMSDMHDVCMMYGKEAADTYDKLYELTHVEWIEFPEAKAYFDESRECYCCGECDNPLWDIRRICCCPYCCVKIVRPF